MWVPYSSARSNLLSGPEAISGTQAGPYKMIHQGSQDTRCKARIPHLCHECAVLTGGQKLSCDHTPPRSGLERAAVSLAMTHVASSCLLSLTLAPSSLHSHAIFLRHKGVPPVPPMGHGSLSIPGLSFHLSLVPFPSPIISLPLWSSKRNESLDLLLVIIIEKFSQRQTATL